MKRDFVFVWGPDVQAAIAALSAPKIEELRACCLGLIARLEYCRQNSMQLVRIVEMPHLTDEDLPWAPFEKFGFWFRLDYREGKRREYVLTFAAPPEPDPPAARAPRRRRASEAAGRPTPGPARPARARRPPKATDKRNLFISYKIGGSELRQGLAALYGPLWSTLARSVQAMRDTGGSFVKRIRGLAGSVEDFLSPVASMPRQFCASFRNSAELFPQHPQAHLEPRLVGQSFGFHVLIHTLVQDEAPAERGGERLQEGERLLL